MNINMNKLFYEWFSKGWENTWINLFIFSVLFTKEKNCLLLLQTWRIV